jgi:hypothetical protein
VKQFTARQTKESDEVCASASDRKRLELARATQRTIDNHFDEAGQSAADNNPTNTFTGPTMSAPVQAPARASAPPPAPAP